MEALTLHKIRHLRKRQEIRPFLWPCERTPCLVRWLVKPLNRHPRGLLEHQSAHLADATCGTLASSQISQKVYLQAGGCDAHRQACEWGKQKKSRTVTYNNRCAVLCGYFHIVDFLEVLTAQRPRAVYWYHSITGAFPDCPFLSLFR